MESDPQPFENRGIDSSVNRPLLCEPQHVLLQRRIRIAGLELIEVADLLIRESGPPTESQVVVQSVMAIGQPGRFEVSQFP